MRANLATVAKSNAQAINEWVASRSAMVNAIAPESLSGDPMPALTQLEKSGNFEVSYVGFPDKHAVFSRDLGIPADYDPTSRPWYHAAVEASKLVLTAPYADIATKKLVVTFARPVMSQGQLKAVVAADVNLDRVVEIVKSIHLTPASFAFIVDGDGRIVAHPDENLNLKPATDLSAELNSSTLGALSSDSATVVASVAGRLKVLHAEPVEGTNWKLVVALDRDEAMAGLRAVVRAILITLFVVVGVAGFVGSVVTSSAFRRLSQVRVAMHDIGAGNGDLTKRLPVHGQDEVAQIALAFNTFADKMSGVLRDIRDTSESVNVAAGEISQGNRDLSARTEQSAASLEETAASMEELTGTVRNSAEAATRAGEMAVSASQVANEGGTVVAEVVSTMHEIAAASTRIRDIIGVIEGIAFQTNILALNAAVEAARAGEQGRGFAVVAGEVRTLAQRSAQASKEIAELINASVSHVDAGAQRVQRAGTTMDTIVTRVQQVADILNEITSAAIEQSTGISQVNQAVAQLDTSTQQNAALVEQSTAASDLLREQAQRLAEVVGQFRLER
jgi:methyl-accepting chemotaxis protein